MSLHPAKNGLDTVALGYPGVNLSGVCPAWEISNLGGRGGYGSIPLPLCRPLTTPPTNLNKPITVNTLEISVLKMKLVASS